MSTNSRRSLDLHSNPGSTQLVIRLRRSHPDEPFSLSPDSYISATLDTMGPNSIMDTGRTAPGGIEHANSEAPADDAGDDNDSTADDDMSIDTDPDDVLKLFWVHVDCKVIKNTSTIFFLREAVHCVEEGKYFVHKDFPSVAPPGLMVPVFVQGGPDAADRIYTTARKMCKLTLEEEVFAQRSVLTMNMWRVAPVVLQVLTVIRTVALLIIHFLRIKLLKFLFVLGIYSEANLSTQKIEEPG